MKAREIAVHTLREIELNHVKSDTSLNRHFGSTPLAAVDRAFTMQIVYGTLREKMKIDHVLSQFYRHNFDQMDIDVKNILRIGVYQLMFLGKVPRWAAVNESVELAKKMKGQFLGNLVNGVLRNISNHLGTIEFSIKGGTFADQIALKFSHPKWLLERWIASYGFPTAQQIMEANNQIPKIAFRINRIKTTQEALIAKLEQENIPYEKSRLADLIIPERFFDLEPFLHTGEVSVQSEAQALACQLLNPKPDQCGLDMCAAPGGKSTYLAELMENKGTITSLDLYENKLLDISNLAKTLGITIIKTTRHDAITFSSPEKFDFVLLDAPCTGTGVLSRRAELRWRLKPDDIRTMSGLQSRLLENAAKLVKDDGVIVYSTCSIEPEENGQLIDAFLSQHPEWKIQPATDVLPADLHDLVGENGTITLLPSENGMDGAFSVRLIRK
ncbi:MAG: 16S rRNA (cytosine(967)-C(5))-methyltransferase [Chlorobiales bacterium]|jgi:16S rRNA (cytosine967-C5)-methyltransferase|nr:16S rRNA (cytosine(967)-C(5))-methyltransferase [Chlorobiales bacterium]